MNSKKIISIITLFMLVCSIFDIGTYIPQVNAQTIGYRRGVNMSCAESAGHIVPGTPGTNYAYVGENAYRYYANKGFDLFRVPVLWERMQQTARGSLDNYNLTQLKNSSTWAKNYGGQIIIDIHNYNSYYGNAIGSANVSVDDFIDLWVKLSDEFKNDTGVYGYDLMNEPINFGSMSWEQISQAVVTAIRANGDNKLIIIEGNSWSSAANWVTANNVEPTTGISKGPWITDPSDNIMYSAHCYFDYNGSGAYTKTYDEELALNPDLANIGVQRVTPFINWCKKYNVRGYIGEYNVPHREDGQDWQDGQANNRWKTVLENFMQTLDEECLDGTAWAAGMWWGPQSKLNVFPVDQYASEFQQDAIMMDVLEDHPTNTTAIPPAEGEKPITYSWSPDRIKDSIQIGSNAKMYKWFDSYYFEDNWFEDNTNYSGYYRPNYWATIDFGEAYDLSRYNIVANAGCGVKGFTLYGSQNGTDWVEIAPPVTNNTADEAIGNFNTGTSVRYVKLQITNRGQNTDQANGWIGIQEVEIYGTPATVAPSGNPVTYGWSTAKVQQLIQIGSNAKMYNWFDGITSGQDNWFEDNTNRDGYYRPNYWVIIDLEVPYDLSNYNIIANAGCGVRGFTFYGSQNGTDWVEIAPPVTTNTADEAIGNFSTGTSVRYVKLQITNRGQNTDQANGWIGVQEVEIYGTPAAVIPSGNPVTYGWSTAKVQQLIQIGSNAKMYKWFDGITSGQDNWFEDNTNRDGYYRPNYWVIIDLEGPFDLSNYNIIANAGCGVRGFTFYGSQNGTDWVEIAPPVTTNTADEAIGNFSTGTSVRYIKLQITNRSQNDADPVHGWIGVQEVEIYGTPAAVIPSGNPVTYGWSTAKVQQLIQIGSNAKMYKWFDGITSGQDNWFEDNTNRDGYYRPNYWVIIDLESPHNLTNYNIIANAGCGVRGFTFYGSQNGTDWVEIAPPVTTNTADEAIGSFNAGTNVRYIKLQITNRGQNDADPVNGWIGIQEVEIYGTPATVTPSWLTEGWSTTKVQQLIQIGSNAKMYKWFDGITSGQDNWFEDNTNRDGYYRPNYWVIIDLESPHNLTNYNIIANAGCGVRGFTFYGSQNGTDWVEIAPPVTTNTADEAIGSFNAGTNVRYIKLQITNRGQNDADPVNGWIGIQEIKIFGY